MSYKPKSTYQILETSGDEYYTLKGEIYVGPYILTSEGAFQGNNIEKIGPILRKRKSNESKRNNIYETFKTQEYYAVNPSIVNFIKQTKFPISTKTKPTPQEYQIGFYTRYFVKKVNSNTEYYEIDKKTYKKIKAKSPLYDYHSFTTDSLIWAVAGDVQKANKSILEQVETKHPNISQLFPNLLEFSRQSKVLNDLIAKPGELVYLDDINKEYIGPYHLHPIKGPMVGAKHTSNPHLRLIFVKDTKSNSLNKTLVKSQHRENHGHGGNSSESVPYIPSKSTQKFLNNLEENNIIITPSTNNPPSTSGGSSGGGGGGY
tara:strand:+ start:2981 stop:3931 length:951 start_codon:yes stop_codon:yes gene_type:complete